MGNINSVKMINSRVVQLGLEKTDVVIDGRKTGEIKPCLHDGGSVYYHASFQMESGFGSLLLQGFGETRAEAVKDAVARSRIKAEGQLRDVQRAERALPLLVTAVCEFECRGGGQ